MGYANKFCIRLALTGIVTILVAEIAMPSSGAEEVLTADRVVSLALERNPDLLAAQQELASAQARSVKAHYLNQFNPQVQGGGSQARFQFFPYGSEPQASGSISLEVEVGGQRRKRIEEADQNMARARANVADTVRLTRARAQYAFYQALYLQQRLELTEKIEALNQRLRDATMIRFHAGETAKLEANLGALRYDESRKITLLARRDYENALRALQRVMGMEPTGQADLSGALKDKPAEIDPTRALETAMTNRPDLQARDYEIKRVAADLALTQRLIVPNPTITGFGERTADSPGQFIRVLGGSLGVSVPLFDRKQAELTDLHGQQRRASYERAAAQLNVEQQVRDALAGYDAAREALELLETDAVGRINESFALIEGSYRQGKTGLLELIVAENDLVNANSSYLESLWNYRIARIEVETVTGVGFETLAKQ